MCDSSISIKKFNPEEFKHMFEQLPVGPSLAQLIQEQARRNPKGFQGPNTERWTLPKRGK